MPPIVHCVRHGQVPDPQGEPKALQKPKKLITPFPKAYHNLKPKNHVMHDPQLTPKGENQCRELCKNFPHHDTVELLVSSPMRRALQTTLIGFEPEVKRGLKVVALPEAQEAGDLPCDTGSDVGVLREEFDEHGPVDLGLVAEDWNVKVGFCRCPRPIERVFRFGFSDGELKFCEEREVGGLAGGYRGPGHGRTTVAEGQA